MDLAYNTVAVIMSAVELELINIFCLYCKAMSGPGKTDYTYDTQE